MKNQLSEAVNVLVVYGLVVLFMVSSGIFLPTESIIWASLFFSLGIAIIPLTYSFFNKHSFKIFYLLSFPQWKNIGNAFLLSTGMIFLMLCFSTILSFFFPDFVSETNELQDELLKARLPVSFFIVVILPAVCEEILCRGFILSSFRKIFPAKIAIPLTALLFGILHIELVSIPFTALVGLGITYAAWETKSLLIPILMHGFHNAFLLFLFRINNEEAASLPLDSSETASLWPLLSVVLFLGSMLVIQGIRGLRKKNEPSVSTRF